ncbi:hypothetical protein ZWY2020_040619 [Hordeum vulgare]|nr:hypothetical protein ZWY2020_040619 [Hordeum vulgare]
MYASASGAASFGSIPASIATLLNLPPRFLAPPISFFGTIAVGSMYSAPLPSSAATATPAMLLATTLTVTPVASIGSSPTLALDSVASGVADVQPPPVTPVAVPSPVVPVTEVVLPAGPFHFDNLITIRLTPDNYSFWRTNILPLLRSRSLLGYVDGSLPCRS